MWKKISDKLTDITSKVEKMKVMLAEDAYVDLIILWLVIHLHADVPY